MKLNFIAKLRMIFYGYIPSIPSMKILSSKHPSLYARLIFFERIPREKNLSFSIFGFNRPSPGEEKKGAKKERARSCEISERVKSSATRRQRVRMESKGKWFSRVHELTKTTPPLFLAVIGRLTCRLSARVPQDRLL